MKAINYFVFPVIAIFLLAAFFTVKAGKKPDTSKKTVRAGAEIVVNVKGYTPLPQDIYGFNTPFARTENPWSHSEYVQLIEKVHPSVIRYPGGTVSSFWDMRNERLFGDKASVGNGSAEDGWVDYSRLGPKQFVAQMVASGAARRNSLTDLATIVQKTGVIPMFCLNICTPSKDYYVEKMGTNDSGFEPGSDDKNNLWWKMMDDRLSRNLDMLNRAKDLGIPIKYIELGNEYYATNEIFKETFPNGAVYAKAANYIAAKIAEKFPEAEFSVACAGEGRTMANNPRIEKWNGEVLPELDQSLIKYITIHAYESTDKAEYSSAKDVLDAAKNWRSNIEDSFNLNSVTRLLIKRHTRIWYTEFEAMFSIAWKDVISPGSSNKTWATSLESACAALYLQFNGNADKIMYHKFDDLINGHGDFVAKGTALVPIYKAAYRMSDASEINFAESSGRSFEYLIGSAYKKNDTIKMAIINLSDRPVEINLKNIFEGNVKVESYYSPDLMATQSISLSDNINPAASVTLPSYSVSLIER